jgi:hypothetical protein
MIAMIAEWPFGIIRTFPHVEPINDVTSMRSMAGNHLNWRSSHGRHAKEREEKGKSRAHAQKRRTKDQTMLGGFGTKQRQWFTTSIHGACCLVPDTPPQRRTAGLETCIDKLSRFRI